MREWQLETDSGSKYFSLLNGNNCFTENELAFINSEAGSDISFASIDGETTRLAVLGYNSEYTPNDVTSFKDITECPAVADVTTPWAPVKDPVDPIHYEDLIGTWTATATLQEGDDSKSRYEYSSIITISDNVYDYPSELPSEVYEIYKKASSYDEDDVNGFWIDFKKLAETFTVNRLMNQNRLLCLGWLDDDTYGRLTARSPYDLFIATDYSSVDVSSIYNDFGPKWYIEAVADESGNVSLVAPVDWNFLPPAANWSVPFYLSGMDADTFYTITYAEDGNLSFPVEYDAEKDQITIKPFEYAGVKYYPNIIGVDSTYGTLLENPVVSEIVLTRATSETKAQSSVRTSSGGNVPVKGEFPQINYKQRTVFKDAPELKKIEYKVMNAEQIRERADKLVERYKNQTR